MANYRVIIDGVPQKIYPYKIQAIIHLYEAKRVYQYFRDFPNDRDGIYIDPDCKIELLES